MAQDVGESLQNNYDPDDPSWFNGSELYSIEANPSLVAASGLGAEALIYNIVEEAIFRLMELQDEDDYVDEAEHVTEIQTLQIQKIGDMSYFFYLVLLNDSDEPVREEFIIRLLPPVSPGIAEVLVGGKETYQDGKVFL